MTARSLLRTLTPWGWLAAALATCDAARRLAVETFEADHALREHWRVDVE
jgi:hypothetical protein